MENIFKDGPKLERERSVNVLLIYFRGITVARPRMTAMKMVGVCRLKVDVAGRRHSSS